MKSTIAVAALFVSACASVPPPGGDSCPAARPSFDVATEAEREVFAYDVDAPLNLEATVESTVEGVRLSTLSYDSPAGGRVTGLLFDPVTREGPRPGLVLMHGLPGNAAQLGGVAQVHAELGAVVIAIDAPFARRSGPTVQFNEEDPAEQIQLIQDLQRAVDVLRSRPNVDPERIAYVGISYGGAMGALFAGIERRIKAVALVVGDGGLVTHFTGPEDAEFMAGLPCETRLSWLDAMSPIEPIRFIPHATSALLLQNGRVDELVPEADGQALQAAAPEATIYWYDAGHGLNQQALVDRHAWLTEQIGLDVWP